MLSQSRGEEFTSAQSVPPPGSKRPEKTRMGVITRVEDGRHNQHHPTLQLLLKQHLERMCGKANFQLKPISNAGRIGGSSLNYQK